MSEKQFVLYEHKEDYYILKNPRIHLDFIEMLGDALTSEEIVEELNQLNDKVVELAEENEQLKKEHKIAIDEMITDYKNLEKENEQLKNELRKEKSLREYSDSMYGADLIVNIRFSNGEWKADVSVIDDE